MKKRPQNAEWRPSVSEENRLIMPNRKPLIVSQRGSALIVTLLIVTILISLTVEFAYDVYIDTSSVANWKNAQKASLIARSGQTVSAAFLKEVSLLPYTYPGEIYLPVSHDFGPNAFLTVKIEDENAKFNINNLIDNVGGDKISSYESNTTYIDLLKNLFEYLTINPGLALTIADWIDPDHESRLPGSEYNAKNDFLWSIEELRLIKGIDNKTFTLITPYLTVNSNNTININTAKLPVLLTLHPEMNENLATKILDYRESTPFESLSQIQTLQGLQTIGQSFTDTTRCTIKSSAYHITSTAEVNDVTRIIESVMDGEGKIKFWREA